jgi:hypothetical protein
MTAMIPDIHHYFTPVLGTPPWRAKLRIGSFLTFEFGPKIKAHGHVHGKWHLWTYLSNWVLLRGERQLVDSDSERKIIAVAIRRLQSAALTEVQLDPLDFKTIFIFEDFRLIVSAADYLDRPDQRDHYWRFFMPGEVLEVGPSGVSIARAAIPQHA